MLRINLPRVLYVQELAALVKPSLVALAQILLHALGVSFKESIVGISIGPADARIFSPDSPYQLPLLGVSPLPLPGCSSRGRRHADLCFCLGVSPPSPPRQPGRSRRRNPFCYLQYGCRKGSLHIINTATAWGKRPEVVSDRCRYLLAQMEISQQSLPVDGRRSTGHIMVTTRYSDQQGSKSRQKSYATLQAIAPTNIKTVHQTRLVHIESNLDRLGLFSPTHDQRSQQQSGQIALQPVLINKSKFLKATHCTKVRKLKYRGPWWWRP